MGIGMAMEDMPGVALHLLMHPTLRIGMAMEDMLGVDLHLLMLLTLRIGMAMEDMPGVALNLIPGIGLGMVLRNGLAMVPWIVDMGQCKNKCFQFTNYLEINNCFRP